PYDGSTRPFTIGLKPLDLAEWIEVDDDLGAYLAEKDRLHAMIPDRVFVEEPDTRQAQQEVLDLLVEYLPARFPGTHRWSDGALIVDAGQRVSLDGVSPPLLVAARLVQEDLVLMRKGDEGWSLVAATLCFPASWSLREKFGRPLQDIHAPVPGFGRGTRTADII
ncbi:heme-dependent oxidative N-demethylase subunit alpha family protein, partial [Rhizobiaceae sp. 2RAB30]